MNPRQLESLIREHQAAVYRYVRFLGAEPNSAEDYVQETFLRAYRAAETPGPGNTGAWRAWLRTAARNLIVTDRRRRHLVTFDQEAIERAEVAWVRVIGDGDGEDQLAALRDCVGALPPRQCQAIDCRYGRGTGRGDMARLMGLTEDGVKMLLRRTRTALAKCVQVKFAVHGAMARTASFLMTTATVGNGNPQVLDTQKVFVRDPGLVRVEGQTTGITTIVSVEDGTMPMLLPPQKKAVIVDSVGPAVLEPFRGFRLDALRKQFDCVNKPLGEQVVNGRQATGLGGIWRPDAGAAFPEFPVEVWVDSATGELVRIVMFPNQNMRSVIDTFVLDPAVDDSLFSLEPPEGYEVETKTSPQH